jgi:phage repressor protein C with HTH and peptisase S24 domain
MPFPENLKYIMNNRKITAEFIADRLGVSRGTVTHWSNGRRFPQKENYIEDLATILEVTVQDLFNPKDKEIIARKELKNNPSKYTDALNVITNDSLITLPYYEDNYACIGTGVQNFSIATKPISFDKLFLRAKLGNIKFDNLHIINAIGNSMEPTISSGELLFVNPYENENTIINGAIYVLNYYGDIMVKRIVRNPKTGEIVLHSDNKNENPSIEIEKADKENYKTMGRVVAHFNWL